MKKLPRILQIIWLAVAAVSIFEAYSILTTPDIDHTSGYIFCGAALFAGMRYIMLRRQQFNNKKKNGEFD